jgi:integrase
MLNIENSASIADAIKTRPKRSNGDGSFRILKNGTYELSVTINYKVERFYGKTKKACREGYEFFVVNGFKIPKTKSVKVAKEIEAKRKAEATGTPIAVEHTLANWFRYWLTTYKKPNVSEGIYIDYCYLAKHVEEHAIGGMKLTEIKSMHVTEYFADKIELSHSFFKRSKFLIKAAFEAAIDNDFGIKNPVKSAQIAKKPVPPKKPVFTEDEMETILEFAKTDEWFGLPIITMYNTATRAQEVRAMTVGQFDFLSEIGIISIDRTIKRNGELGLTKSNEARPAPLEPEVTEFIKKKIAGIPSAATTLFLKLGLRHVTNISSIG